MTEETKKRLADALIKLRNDLDIALLEMGDAAANNPDLRENFAYMESERRSEYLKARIIDVKEKLAYAKIIDLKENAKEVEIGVTVTIRFTNTGEEFTYTLLGEEDALTRPGEWLNYKSQLGEALLRSGGGDFELGLEQVKIIKIY